MMIIALSARGQQDATLDRQLADIVQRDSITVLVTDSGLGGLSVCAAVDSLARVTGRYTQMRLIFANALPESGSGYNRMRSLDEKVRVFDAAIRGMAGLYHPDVVLIACNTLSVVYPLTSFAREAPMPVVGIVTMGVDLLEEELRKRPGGTAIVFGTETTIGAGTHKRLLMERGVRPDRIIAQACPELAGKIERDARGESVQDAIGQFAGEAVAKSGVSTERIVAALCCTHYGYCAGFFQAALAKQTGGEVTILDPNMRMSRLLFPDDRRISSASPEVSVHVVSRAEITPEEILSIGTLLLPVSAPVAAALRRYELKRELFPFSNE
jgi:glutamate racemase